MVADRVVDFFSHLADAMGPDVFGDRTLIFRTAHGLYALAIIVNDIADGKTSLKTAVKGLAAVDWSWKNADFRRHIGRQSEDKHGAMRWQLNTGSATIDWLIGYCRHASKVPVPRAA